MSACRHESCTCQIAACGIEHPANWKPKVHVRINGVICGGDDYADCMAHYLLQAGYPTDRPAHLRRISEGIAAKRGAR